MHLIIGHGYRESSLRPEKRQPKRSATCSTGCRGWRARVDEELKSPTTEERREAEATEWLAAKPDLKTMKRDDYKDECIDKIRNHRTRLPVPRVACRAQVGGPDQARKARAEEANQKIIVTPIRGT